MPPPPSPSSRSVSLNEPETRPKSSTDLATDGRALQDRIDQLLSGKGTPSSQVAISPRPDSSASFFSSTGIEETARNLQSQLDALQADNQFLRAQSAVKENEESFSKTVQDERAQALLRIAELEAALKDNEVRLLEHSSKVEALERNLRDASADKDKADAEGELRASNLQSRLDDAEALVQSLKDAIVAKEGAEVENNTLIKAKDAELSFLQSRVDKANTQLEEERKELNAQVDELRQAGQVSRFLRLTRPWLKQQVRKPLRFMRSASVLLTASDMS
jgi:CAP-Gly domain-containing linker protein 1